MNAIADAPVVAELRDLDRYPSWVREVVEQNAVGRRRVVEHRLVREMREATLAPLAARRLLVGMWPTIEQFPQFMALSLLKTRYGRHPGEDLARQYLIRNIRVENKHAEYWVHWAEACGVSLDTLRHDAAPAASHALAHWCWSVCATEDLAVAVAATNYAVEGATGDMAIDVCSKTHYESTFAPEHRRTAMRWLKLHAHYDDEHPWEALQVVAALLGRDPSTRRVEQVADAIRKSYAYMAMTFDACFDD